ncbi:MAG: 4-alpha-glucanotransferase [Pseudomonadota bacterium]
MQSWLEARQAGVLLHPTSLPGGGDLGPGARGFVAFMEEAGFGVWQMLPLGPVDATGSPYLSASSYAGNTALISPEDLRAHGLLTNAIQLDNDRDPERHQLLEGVQRALPAHPEHQRALARFRDEQSHWLTDYALFRCLARIHDDRPWVQWPAAERDRDPGRLAALKHQLATEIERECLGQYLFSLQWQALHDYAANRGIRLFGDIPIYVAHNSADVWCRPELFDLDDTGLPREVAGVPPDAFAHDGQHWGNPLYRWDRLEQEGFQWWIDRLAHQLQRFDLLRLDHFRGFEAYWAIPASALTAAEGCWRQGPGTGLFSAIFQALGPLPLVAEDLGEITPAVERLRRELACPGMRVLQFAFDGDASNPHRPHNHRVDSVVYTGTHDNDTTLGWWHACDETTRATAMDYLASPSAPMPWPLIQSAFDSVAQLAIIPLQDLMALGSEARMNTPGTAEGNWQWQLPPGEPSPDMVPRLRRALAVSGRARAVTPSAYGPSPGDAGDSDGRGTSGPAS